MVSSEMSGWPVVCDEETVVGFGDGETLSFAAIEPVSQLLRDRPGTLVHLDDLDFG